MHLKQKSVDYLYRDYHMTIFISYPRINPRIMYHDQPSTLASAIGPSALGLIRESRADTGFSGWYEVRYENCHIVIFLSYILIHDHFFPFFVLFIYLFYFYLILFLSYFIFILFYFYLILFYLFWHTAKACSRAHIISTLAQIENSSRLDKIMLPVT